MSDYHVEISDRIRSVKCGTVIPESEGVRSYGEAVQLSMVKAIEEGFISETGLYHAQVKLTDIDGLMFEVKVHILPDGQDEGTVQVNDFHLEEKVKTRVIDPDEFPYPGEESYEFNVTNGGFEKKEESIVSNLKHMSPEELQRCKVDCERYIARLKSKLNGQQERLTWIERYLHEKTPQEMSIREIEERLGHKVIIK